MNLRNNIDWNPKEYADAAIVAEIAENEMLSRLDWMTIKPKVILDIGCGLGTGTAKLQARYPDAKIISIDVAYPMLANAKNQAKLSAVMADAEKLPLALQSVDMIFANLTLPWCDSFLAILKTWRVFLRDNGLLMLSTLGLQTAQEYTLNLIPRLLDMHDLGDALQQAGLSDPVVDSDRHILSYKNAQKLAAELLATGMCAEVDSDSFHKQENSFDITYEVIYGHAFAPTLAFDKTENDGTVRVPLSYLREQLRSKV